MTKQIKSAASTPAVTVQPRVLFLGSGYAGHRTRFRNLQMHTGAAGPLSPTFKLVTGWDSGGVIERVPLLPQGVAGRVRSVAQAASVLKVPRYDAVWTAAGRELSPFVWPLVGELRPPLVLDLDWTLEQQEQWSEPYFGRRPKSGWKMSFARAFERMLWSRVTLFAPWSRWAADSLRRGGVDGSKIRVNPPGVDLKRFQPGPLRPHSDGDRLRLLFIGGDFVRKGGDILLKVVRAFADDCELDVVTRDAIPESENVRVHRAEPNSPRLLELLAKADVFVMPTKAECFGIATVEAMASGLPTIIGDVGAAREIVCHGGTGWLVKPTEESLAEALRVALAGRQQLRSMGLRARAVAEERFDGAVNDRRVINTVLEAIALSESTRPTRGTSTRAIR